MAVKLIKIKILFGVTGYFVQQTKYLSKTNNLRFGVYSTYFAISLYHDIS